MLVQAQQLLQKHFGYISFKEGQAEIIGSLLEGGDTLAIMPTGAGKSLCYQLPSLIFGGLTLVVSPLIALMKDQVDGMSTAGIPAAFINSSLPGAEVARRVEQAGKGRFKLLYVAPERLEMHDFLEMARAVELSFVAVDEAHCISQWGHDFRPSYRKIAEFIRNLPRRPVLGAFTATATPEIRQDIVRFLDFREPHIFVSGFDRQNLHFAVARGVNKKKYLLDYLREKRDQPGIVYAATRREVDSIFELLREKGCPCAKYHAGMNARERKQSQEDFIHDRVTVMVATNAFGMGIDKSNVRYVLHYNMPKNIEAYYQEAGRAGRDGEPGECLLLFGARDPLLQKYMIGETVYAPRRRANEYRKLQLITDYCHTSGCLRRFIRLYFGEQGVPQQCGNCGNCSDDSELVEITLEAQMILSCVVRVRERYGVGMIADILKGSRSKRVLRLHLDGLSTYGLMRDYPLPQIKELINLLAAEGYLAFTGGDYPVIRLGPKAAAPLRDGEKVWQRRRKKKAAPAPDRLFERMRRLRKEIASREGVPPYIIFSDSTLRELTERLPRDRESLLQVKGIGQVKMERFGEPFLRLIKEHLEQQLRPS